MHQLYRHFNAEGVLLYIGESYNALARLRGHKNASHWYWDIKTTTHQNFPSKAAALVAEAEAIKEEKPLYNIKHNTLGPRVSVDLDDEDDYEDDKWKNSREVGGLMHSDSRGAWIDFNYDFAKSARNDGWGQRIWILDCLVDWRYELLKLQELNEQDMRRIFSDDFDQIAVGILMYWGRCDEGWIQWGDNYSNADLVAWRDELGNLYESIQMQHSSLQDLETIWNESPEQRFLVEKELEWRIQLPVGGNSVTL